MMFHVLEVSLYQVVVLLIFGKAWSMGDMLL